LVVPDANIVGPSCRVHEEHKAMIGDIELPDLRFTSSR
jgi:hypothetical protein